MVAERAARAPHRRAGTAGHLALEHDGARVVRKESERLHRWPEQRDDARPDPGAHVHHAGVARNENARAGETGARFVLSDRSGGGCAAAPALRHHLAILVASDADDPKPELLELAHESLPMGERPA